jgi:LmbE family N-acetylglucosaminyl deacetylase
VTRVFLAPHPDDETLFGTFTLLRHKPLVVCVLDCGADRTVEFNAACDALDVPREQWPFPEAAPDWMAIRERVAAFDADVIYAPAWAERGNSDHNRVAAIADQTHPGGIVHYCTYTTDGKQTDGTLVAFETEWVSLKLRALACYPSQSGHPSHAPHFIRDQSEYVAIREEELQP